MLGKDIAFPKHALPIICTQIEEGRIPPGLATSMYGRIEWVLRELKTMKASCPGGGDFAIFHGSRNSHGNKSTFGLIRHRYDAKSDTWSLIDYDLEGGESHLIEFDGTGGKLVFDEVLPLKTGIGAVSRIHFAGFCNALNRECPDDYSGGAPQLLGLGSVGAGRYYGVQTTKGTFFRGSPASFDNVPPNTQWRDETFQPVGPKGSIMKNRRRKLIKGKRRPPKQV
ncbi:hypothetical protein G3N96_33390 [Burkholderia sp. Se-20373]|uniref:hypothetical protein n=1 Tax=Burkholderia sp. Se-20373 TaxID=2703898 RepID=UPI00197E0C10|nr:hypothetical protein [Burkholderia sp. Se-20373]MBN3750279.1 hypothetical protein [Burkholderia sp. Se-20373]